MLSERHEGPIGSKLSCGRSARYKVDRNKTRGTKPMQTLNLNQPDRCLDTSATKSNLMPNCHNPSDSISLQLPLSQWTQPPSELSKHLSKPSINPIRPLPCSPSNQAAPSPLLQLPAPSPPGPQSRLRNKKLPAYTLQLEGQTQLSQGIYVLGICYSKRLWHALA